MSTTHPHDIKHHQHHDQDGRARRGRGSRTGSFWEVPMDQTGTESGGERRDPRGSRGRGRRSYGPEGETGDSRPFGPGFGPGYGPDYPGPGFGGRGPRGGHFGRRGGGRRGGRGGRGDVRAAVLLLLETEPMHGYELIQRIQDKSGGLWAPSPGSIYPALQQLEDEGLVAFERVDGRKTASLTEAGQAYVQEHRAELGSPWDDVSGGVSGEARELRQLIGALMGAAHTVSQVGTRDQVRQAGEVLVQARKSLYRILAEDAPAPTAEPGDQPTS